MRRALLAAAVLVVSLSGLFTPSTATPSARSLDVTGVGAAMYPTFDPTIDRYALTTTDTTAGTVDVAVTPGPGESVTIDGGSSTHLTGVAPGQRIKVSFTGGTSPHTYTVMYLPAGFPKLTVTTGAQGSFPDLQPGLIGLTLNTFEATVQPFDAIVDRNGVPVWTKPTPHAEIDLKQEPTGEITVSRPTSLSGHTGVSLTVLGANLDDESARYDVVDPLTNTDGHDAVRLPDGSTILIGYEWNAATSKTDATIQKIGPDGQKLFQWSSAPYAAETMADSTTQGVTGDYAHINSVVSVENGDIIASFRHLSAAYRIATVDHDGHQAGDVIWKFGGKDSTFTFPNDALGGPCAQHSVSELPNGHLLVYDNGTNGLCVDPLNRSGPSVNRGFTRITEYALDIPGHTATLVWDDTPAGKYSLFAGSARRMSNGDTLVDWASDRNALTTEVDANKDVLWELATPATDLLNTKRYASYRAELITSLRPRISTAVADGATALVGDTVPAGPTCTDWRGDVLDCTVTGLPGANLDTTMVGTHTWQVSAQDGAGNTTTVTRHYTVRLPDRQPDGLIRKGGRTSWHGGNVYGGPTGESVRQDARRTHTSAASWQVQNDGERADAFRLVAAGSNRRFRVHYLAGGVDVTRAVVTGTYVTPALEPGQSVTLTVTITPTRRARIGVARTIPMAAVSVSDIGQVDRVASIFTTRR